MVSPEFSWLSALKCLHHPHPHPHPWAQLQDQACPHNYHLPQAWAQSQLVVLLSHVWFKAEVELPARAHCVDQSNEQAQDALGNWLPQALPVCFTEENEVGCPEGFEPDAQGAFCVGEFFPAGRKKGDLSFWDVQPTPASWQESL